MIIYLCLQSAQPYTSAFELPHAFSIRQTDASGAMAQAVPGLKHGMTAFCIYGKAETVTKAIEPSTSPERRGPSKP